MAVKDSNQEEIQKVLSNGGIIYLTGVRIYVDNPSDYETVESPTGFWVLNAMGWRTYFKCPDNARMKAQKACDALFGVGAYKVNSKV